MKFKSKVLKDVKALNAQKYVSNPKLKEGIEVLQQSIDDNVQQEFSEDEIVDIQGENAQIILEKVAAFDQEKRKPRPKKSQPKPQKKIDVSKDIATCEQIIDAHKAKVKAAQLEKLKADDLAQNPKDKKKIAKKTWKDYHPPKTIPEKINDKTLDIVEYQVKQIAQTLKQEKILRDRSIKDVKETEFQAAAADIRRYAEKRNKQAWQNIQKQIKQPEK
ncbi:hypothetical protein BKI52_02760 [marine bacterium AO1-C]|nr:hypothetical protein BKI52_02760 [marine bacterium AO1-C]